MSKKAAFAGLVLAVLLALESFLKKQGEGIEGRHREARTEY